MLAGLIARLLPPLHARSLVAGRVGMAKKASGVLEIALEPPQCVGLGCCCNQVCNWGLSPNFAEGRGGRQGRRRGRARKAGQESRCKC